LKSNLKKLSNTNTNTNTSSSVSYGGGLVKATDLTTQSNGQSNLNGKHEEMMEIYINENLKKLQDLKENENENGDIVGNDVSDMF